MKRGYALAGLALIAGVLVFAVISFVRENWAASGTPGGLERWLAGLILSSSRSEAAARPNPIAVSPGTLAQGQQLYEKHCAFCHGIDGKGPATEGMKFYPPVPSLAPFQQPRSDGEIFAIVELGIRYTAMPSFREVFSDEDIWKISSYVQSLARVPAATQTSN